jgi:DNA-binding CsgD family transcriptional regulator
MPAQTEKKQLHCRPTSFALCERSSGAVRFRVEAEADGGLPVERVAGFLAMHCLVGGLAPEDFEVMVVTQESLLDAVFERTAQLLAAGRAIDARVRISRREKEVLEGVLKSQANKEIASDLNVSERTVKFHVSSLLAKFGVADRGALCREVILGRVSASLPDGQIPGHNVNGYPARSQEQSSSTAATLSRADLEGRRARRRLFTIFPRERYAT